MPKFVIERTVPGAGKLSPAELQAAARKACGSMGSMGSDIQWIETFVTADKMFCVFYAPDEATLRLHSQGGGLPVDTISELPPEIDPEGGSHVPVHRAAAPS